MIAIASLFSPPVLSKNGIGRWYKSLSGIVGCKTFQIIPQNFKQLTYLWHVMCHDMEIKYQGCISPSSPQGVNKEVCLLFVFLQYKLIKVG